MRQALGVIFFTTLLSAQRVLAASFNVDQTRPTVAYTAPFNSVPNIIQDVLNFILLVAGIIFVVLFFVGGISYLSGAGDEKQTGRAKRILVDAIVGLILTLAAWAVSNFIYGYLTKGQGARVGTSTNTATASISNLPPATSSTSAPGATVRPLPTVPEGAYGGSLPPTTATKTAAPQTTGGLPQPTASSSRTSSSAAVSTASPPIGQFPQL